MELSAKVDGILLISRVSVVRRPMINELVRMLSASPAEKLGFVLTGAELEEGYGYGAGYGSYYYDTARTEELEPERSS
jgi:hypothetical protein